MQEKARSSHFSRSSVRFVPASSFSTFLPLLIWFRTLDRPSLNHLDMGGKKNRRQGRRGSGHNQQKEAIQVTESPVTLTEEQGSAEKISKSPLDSVEGKIQQEVSPSLSPLPPAFQLTDSEKTQTTDVANGETIPSKKSQVQEQLSSDLVPLQQVSVATAGLSKNEEDQNIRQGPHPLETFWTCYYTDPDVPKHMWKLAVKEVHAFRSVEEFWSVFNHLTPPTKLKRSSDLSWFRWVGEHQVRPEWEDGRNKKGGCWKVVFLQNPKDTDFDVAYKEVLMLLIGEQFGGCSEIVNGMVAQTRGMDDVRLQVWTSTVNETSNRPIARRIIKALRDQKMEVMMEFHDFCKPQRLLFKVR